MWVKILFKIEVRWSNLQFQAEAMPVFQYRLCNFQYNYSDALALLRTG